MELYIFNRELELEGVSDDFNSLIWIRRYFKPGEFTLVAPLTDDNINLLKRENIIYKKGDNEAGYIETMNLKLNEAGQEEIHIQGKFLTNYLSRRIIWGNDSLNSTVEVAMRNLVNKNAITAPAERIIPNLVLGSLKGYSETIKKSISYATVSDVLQEIAESNGFGFRINFNHLARKLEFEVYKGVNRTVNQISIAPCIFSRDFENILQQEYIDSLNNYKNVVLVAGAGEGALRRKTSLGFASGLDRHELFVDAREISDKKMVTVVTEEIDEEGNTVYEEKEEEVSMTDSEYIPLLKQKGNEALSECYDIQSFESLINSRGNNAYKVDYELGDLVTVYDEKWKLTLDTRITEIEEIYEGGTVEIRPTFGNNVPTILDKLKRRVK